MRRHLWTAWFLTGCTFFSLVTGCGTKPLQTATSAEKAPARTETNVVKVLAAAPRTTGPFKVGLVIDARGKDDKGFNHLAYLGLLHAHRTLGIEEDVTSSSSSTDDVQNLSAYAANGYNLVIAVGYLMDDAVRQVSKVYPNTQFVILDDALSGRPNVTSVAFRTEQAGYLAGALAGLMEQTKLKGMNPQNVVGVVGGENIPPVTAYVAGFEQGVKKTDPHAKIDLAFARTFIGQSVGRSLADEQIVDGADIIFQVAADVGIGVFQACHQSGVYAIGVDTNQRYLDPETILTSAIKGMDSATYGVIEQARAGQLKPGITQVGVADGDVRLASTLPVVPKHILAEVNALGVQIQTGKIQVSTTLPSQSKT